jgi:hypothetical protein
MALKQVSLLTVHTHKISAVSSCIVPLTSVSRRPAASPRFQAYVHPVTQHTHNNTAFALDKTRVVMLYRLPPASSTGPTSNFVLSRT